MVIGTPTDRDTPMTASLPPNVRPIVLANSSNLNAWPLSRVEHPVQFLQENSADSLFQQTLACARELAADHRIIVFCSVDCVPRARQQMMEIGLDQNRLLVEPCERPSLAAMTVTALAAEQADPDTPLIWMDAAKPPQDQETFIRTVCSMLASQHLSENIIQCVQASRRSSGTEGGGDSQQLCLGQRIENECLFRPVYARDDTDFRYVDALGPLLARPSVFVRRVAALFPDLVNRATRAMLDGESYEETGWLQWTACSQIEGVEDVALLQDLPDSCLLRPVDFIRSRGDVAEEEAETATMPDSINCRISGQGHTIVVAGCEDLDIITTPDATLIRHRDWTGELDECLSNLRRHRAPELFQTRINSTPWGRS